MRVIQEFIKEEVRISIFSWNNKYLVKFELGPMEQTFKIPELDVMDEGDLQNFYQGVFFESVLMRFEEMGETFRKELENL
ncbi:hypothetical protein [Mongoliitalea daihaiensis]|uniref:hypothetical protein n=1 Tax=Mongoliitalea daihaiensis TaxID=2782006 RepID=UPI001F21397E|nr:hypothetical protein [Mongoliitalea daihaiensis]UJP63725.1 hypothetical protein IPZ59_12895 [Mongoliitalea daihaiensis]